MQNFNFEIVRLLCMNGQLTTHPDFDILIKISIASFIAANRSSVQTPGKPASTAMEDFFGEVYIVTETPGTALANRINNEILEYRLLPNIPVTENPLLWWTQHSSNYPLLSRVAYTSLAFLECQFPVKEF